MVVVVCRYDGGVCDHADRDVAEVAGIFGRLSVPDMMASGYDAAYLNMLFDRLGEVGRHFYLRRQLALMLHRYPDISAVQAVSASAFTATKSLFGALTLLAVAVLLALWGIRRRKAVC